MTSDRYLKVCSRNRRVPRLSVSRHDAVADGVCRGGRADTVSDRGLEAMGQRPLSYFPPEPATSSRRRQDALAMSHLVADIRYAFRSLVRSPLVTALGIAILALGIGATTALFSLLDAVVLRALPYAEPERLVEVFGQEKTRTGMRIPGPSFRRCVNDRRRCRISLHGPVRGVLRTPGGAVDLLGDRVFRQLPRRDGRVSAAGAGLSGRGRFFLARPPCCSSATGSGSSGKVAIPVWWDGRSSWTTRRT